MPYRRNKRISTRLNNTFNNDYPSTSITIRFSLHPQPSPSAPHHNNHYPLTVDMSHSVSTHPRSRILHNSLHQINAIYFYIFVYILYTAKINLKQNFGKPFIQISTSLNNASITLITLNFSQSPALSYN